MTSRHIKNDEGVFFKGINGKKLRYIFDKKQKKIIVKFYKNWTPIAIGKLELTFSDYNIEYENNKRGRPGKSKTPKQIPRIKETKIKNLKTAATYDTSDEEEENMEDYFKPYEIGNRVKLIIEPYNIGEIINFDYSEKLIIIKEYDTKNLIQTPKKTIKKMRGRKPKSNINVQKKERKPINDTIDETLELLKIEGKMYIINKENEVMTLNGDYIGEYLNGEII